MSKTLLLFSLNGNKLAARNEDVAKIRSINNIAHLPFNYDATTDIALILSGGSGTSGFSVEGDIDEISVTSKELCPLPDCLKTELIATCLFDGSKPVPVIALPALHLWIQQNGLENLEIEFRLPETDAETAEPSDSYPMYTSCGQSFALKGKIIEAVRVEDQQIAKVPFAPCWVEGLMFSNSRVIPLIRPCVLYTTSLTSSKIIARSDDSFFKSLRDANNRVSLRLSFRVVDKSDPISFFIPAKVNGINQYKSGKKILYLFSLAFTQKVPDDLIEIIGQLLEASANAQKRREERILITEESVRGLGLHSSEGFLEIAQVIKKCIIRDLSFSGAKVLSAAWENLSENDEAILRLVFDAMEGSVDITAKVVRIEEVNWLTLPGSSRTRMPYGDEKIGNGLVRIGAMTRGQAEEVLKRRATGDSRGFGQIAVELGYVDDEAIRRYLNKSVSP